MTSSLQDSVILTRFRKTQKEIVTGFYWNNLFLFGLGLIIVIYMIICIMAVLSGSKADFATTVNVIFKGFTILTIILTIYWSIRNLILMYRDIIKPRNRLLKILYMKEEGVSSDSSIGHSAGFYLLCLVSYLLSAVICNTWYPEMYSHSVFISGLGAFVAGIVVYLAYVAIIMIMRYKSLKYKPETPLTDFTGEDSE